MAYRYSKPTGYNTLCFTNGQSGRSYKPWNGFNNGSQYAPGNLSPRIVTLTFTGTPADNSQIIIPDGPFNDPASGNKTFTFDWGGSPGAGIIPLAVGGGTAAQAATAAQNVLSAQLTQWTVNLTSATTLVITSRQPITVGPSQVGVTNITLTTVLAGLRAILPARFGKVYAWLANDTVSVPTA